MFVSPFTKDSLGKSSQWVTLTRAAAVAAVHDRIVEPWFETFAGVHWRCKFIAESLQARFEPLLGLNLNSLVHFVAMEG